MDHLILREWLLNNGQRQGRQRLAHFLCEMAARLELVGGHHEDDSIDFPIGQQLLADTLGLTTVHVNRILQCLRSDGLIDLSGRCLRVFDHDRLVEIAGFEGRYLARPARPFEPSLPKRLDPETANPMSGVSKFAELS